MTYRKITIQPMDPLTGAAMGGSAFDLDHWQTAPYYTVTGYEDHSGKGNWTGTQIAGGYYLPDLAEAGARWIVTGTID